MSGQSRDLDSVLAEKATAVAGENSAAAAAGTDGEVSLSTRSNPDQLLVAVPVAGSKWAE